MNKEEKFGIVGTSPIIREMLKLVEEAARSEAPVLISGETGTGKELLARTLHAMSPRSERPLVKISCAGIAADLLESRLFGDEMESLDGGTLLLDEVSALPFGLQARLASALLQNRFGSAGREGVRLSATTAIDLGREVETGTFHDSLYRRLMEAPIEVPPLRERKEDIPSLARAFVRLQGARIGKKVETIPQQVLDLLQAYRWPGNVLELKNIILRALILSRGGELELEDGLLMP